jgi:hypothetical protein
MVKMDQLSPGLLFWLGKLGTILSYDLPASVFANTSRALFEPPQVRLSYFQQLADACFLQEDNSFLRADALTVALGDQLNYHFDELNDPRWGYDVVTVGTLLVDASTYLSLGQLELLMPLLELKGLNPMSLRFTVVSYTRRLGGDLVGTRSGRRCAIRIYLATSQCDP